MLSNPNNVETKKTNSELIKVRMKRLNEIMKELEIIHNQASYDEIKRLAKEIMRTVNLAKRDALKLGFN